MFKPNIDKDELKNLPRITFPGQIIVANTIEDIENLIPIFSKEEVLGFDTESRPSFKKGKQNGVSIMQIATGELAAILRLKKTGIPDSLKDLLENPNIIKVGAAIHDDLKGIIKFRKFEPKGFFDLQHIAPTFGIEELSVKKLSAIVLGGTISKRQQLSNWEAEILTDAQMSYAATDAWVCREIYIKLKTANPQL
ncbi:MAG: hypothetical protein PWR03_1852 [Tenuifilum sp.]|jgi:ribonuclease D|uniref:3'-5' exonuclease n=1 Tax=Tenuifilum sp. TaxID=2760880 RepID=UPI0024AB2590|nr:3'-5' exonuclease [Tenuifilum sp.]MDI3527669.1 hypothetical protein [Tenuifilum sp.]